MKRFLSILTLVCFVVTGQAGMPPVYAQEFRLPAPGVRVNLSPEFNPAILKGIKVHPENPFRFEFILDQGDFPAKGGVGLKQEATRLIKYFLASLTIPEKDLWVNLSPYEKNRIVPESFGRTEMGRDLLAEDYMLKQITASLIYPEGETGKRFWKRVYEEAAEKFGTTNIPVNTFNKVWIVPEKAVVFENAKAGTAYVVESKLKVMLERDYLALSKHANVGVADSLGNQIIREIVIPELTKEVNEDKNFAQLRQVYNSLILATWYKKKIKDSILEQVYADKKKTAGIGYGPSEVESIYQRYLLAFKKGAYNYIKEEQDPITQKSMPRKYFSGGTDLNLDGLLEQSKSLPENVSSGNFMIVQEQTDLVPISLSVKSNPGALDGLTILRFSHSMKLTGGLEMYLSELDRSLLQRNRVTIIQVFYSTDQALGNTEMNIGRGRLIQIPIIYNPEVKSIEGAIKGHLIDFVKRNGLAGEARRILASKNWQMVLKLAPVVRKYYQSSYPVGLLRRKLEEVLREYEVNLIVNHDPELLNESSIINKEGEKNKVPVAIQHHGSNQLFSQNPLLLDALVKNSSPIATVSSLDIPDELEDRTTVLWDGIDTDFFDPTKVTDDQEEGLRKELGIRSQDRIVLLPARIHPLKGQLDMFKALLISRRNNVHYKVFFVGEEQSKLDQSQIEEWVIKNGMGSDVVFTGNFPKSKLRTMYKISDVVVLPSASEGTGRVLLEAQAMQKPVVAYANSGMREALVDGQTGYLVADKDVNEFASKIEILLKDQVKRETMGKHGREFVLNNFTLQALAERHERFYLSVLRKARDKAMLSDDEGNGPKGKETPMITSDHRLRSNSSIIALVGTILRKKKTAVVYDVGIGWRHGPRTVTELADALPMNAEVFGIDRVIPELQLDTPEGEVIFDKLNKKGRIVSWFDINWETHAGYEIDSHNRTYFMGLLNQVIEHRLADPKIKVVEYPTQGHERKNLEFIEADIFRLGESIHAMNILPDHKADIVRIADVIFPHYTAQDITAALRSLLPYVNEGGKVLIGGNYEFAQFTHEDYLVYEKEGNSFYLRQYAFSSKFSVYDRKNVGETMSGMIEALRHFDLIIRSNIFWNWNLVFNIFNYRNLGSQIVARELANHKVNAQAIGAMTFVDIKDLKSAGPKELPGKMYRHLSVKFSIYAAPQQVDSAQSAGADRAMRSDQAVSARARLTSMRTYKGRLKSSNEYIWDWIKDKSHPVIYDFGIGYGPDGPSTVKELAEDARNALIVTVDSQIPDYEVTTPRGRVLYDMRGNVLSIQGEDRLVYKAYNRFVARYTYFKDIFLEIMKRGGISGQFTFKGENIQVISGPMLLHQMPNIKYLSGDLFDLSSQSDFLSQHKADIVRIANVVLPHYKQSKIVPALEQLMPFVNEGGLVLIGRTSGKEDLEQYLIYQKKKDHFILIKYVANEDKRTMISSDIDGIRTGLPGLVKGAPLQVFYKAMNMTTEARQKGLNDLLSRTGPFKNLKATITETPVREGTKVIVNLYRGRFNLGVFVDMTIVMKGSQITFFRIGRNKSNADWVKANSRDMFLVMLVWFKEYFPEIRRLIMGLYRDGGVDPRAFFDKVLGELVEKNVMIPDAFSIDDSFDMDFLGISLSGINTEALSAVIPVDRAMSVLSPIPAESMPGFYGFNFPRGTRFGSEFNWMTGNPYADDLHGSDFVHRGVDIFQYVTGTGEIKDIPPETPVLSIESGRVIAGYEQGSEDVIVETNDNRLVIYSHIQPLVAKGEAVNKGDKLGVLVPTMDNPRGIMHLHLEVRQKMDNVYRRSNFSKWVLNQPPEDPLEVFPVLMVNARIARDITIDQAMLNIEQGPKGLGGGITSVDMKFKGNPKTVLTDIERIWILQRKFHRVGVGGETMIRPHGAESYLDSVLSGEKVDAYDMKADVKGKDVLLIPGYGSNAFILAEAGANSVTVYDKDPVTIAWMKAIKKYFHYREYDPQGNPYSSIGELLNSLANHSAVTMPPSARQRFDPFYNYFLHLITDAVEMDDRHEMKEDFELDKRITFNVGDSKTALESEHGRPFDTVFVPNLLGLDNGITNLEDIESFIRDIRKVAPHGRLLITPSQDNPDHFPYSILHRQGLTNIQELPGLREYFYKEDILWAHGEGLAVFNLAAKTGAGTELAQADRAMVSGLNRINSVPLGSGAVIRTSLPEQIIRQKLNTNYFIVRTKRGRLQTTELSDDEWWKINGTSFKALNSRFDLLEQIKAIAEKRRDPEQWITILDWGCGDATTIEGLLAALKEQHITHVHVIGYANEYNSAWQHGDLSGVELILDTADRLFQYVKPGVVDLVYSYHGLRHYDPKWSPLSTSEYFRRMASLLRPGGVMITDRVVSVDPSVPGTWPWTVERKSDSQVWRMKETVKQDNGGIDLTPANMNLQTNGDGNGIKFHIDPAQFEQLQNTAGFVPVIINIRPMNNLREFLGV